jgi:hypothetical protein
VVHARVAELVVGGALLGVGENLVGLLGLLEFLLRGLVVRGAVRMVLHRELPIGLLDLLVGGVAVDAEHRVVIALFRHVSRFPASTRRCVARPARTTRARPD